MTAPSKRPDDARQQKPRAAPTSTGTRSRSEDKPGIPVNVTGNEFRFSISGDFGRALYEKKKRSDGEHYWRARADLPHVHARVVRRDGTARRIGVEYVISADQDSERILITDEDLSDGQWARRLGMNLSGDRTILIAAETAIREIAHRFAIEREAVPRPGAYNESGHLDVPMAESLPGGYLVTPPAAASETSRAVMADVIEIVSRHPKMALTMGASASSPYVAPLGRPHSHWWDLYGDSHKGKSTTQAVAASLWGDPRIGTGIVNSWNTTPVGLQRLCGSLGILPPFFDERGLNSSWRDGEWGSVLYASCQGSARLIADKDSSQGTKRGQAWFGVLFSTGNARLGGGAAGGLAGVPARLIELSTPFTDNAAEARRLTHDLLPHAYGWLGAALLQANPLPVVREFLATAENELGRPEGSVAGSIAEHLHLAVAGAMMIDAEMGTDTLTPAAYEAAHEHLATNAHEPPHDADRYLDWLAENLTTRRPAWPTEDQYVSLGQARPDFGADGVPQHGYDHEIRGIRSLDDRWLYVFPSTWQSIASEHGLDSAVACKTLHARGVLHVPESRLLKGEWQASPRIDGKPRRVYQLDIDAIEPADQDPDQDGPEPISTEPVSGQQEIATLTATGPGTGRDGEPGPCDQCTGAGPSCGVDIHAFADTLVEQAGPQPCLRCGEPTVVYSLCGASRHADCGSTAESPADASGREPGANPRQARSSRLRATQQAEKERQHAALAEGDSLRLLHALETSYAPRRRDPETRRVRTPLWRPELPGIWQTVHVISSWNWSRDYHGDVRVLDRSGAFVAAASSVDIAHGALAHTGPLDRFDGAPGYYEVQVHPWNEAGLPHPIQGAERRDTVWLPAPAVKLLDDLDKAGRWPGLDILDSYTGHAGRLREWAGMVNDLRADAIENHGRDSDEYAAVKENFGMALSLLLGTTNESGTGKTWKCFARRPDWTQTIHAQASATLWRWADDCRAMSPELAPVALRNVDEIVLPAEAVEIVTTQKRPGGRAPMTVDPSGIKLGSFKVKGDD